MARYAWEAFRWRSGEDTYSFEIADGGLFGTLTHLQGKSVTLPMAAWEGMLDSLQLARKTRAERGNDRPERSGTIWTPKEIDRLSEGFGQHRTIAQLAHAHARSPAAIEAQLEKLGLWNRLEHRPMRERGDRPPEPLSAPMEQGS